MAHAPRLKKPGAITIYSKKTPGKKLLNWIPCPEKKSRTSMSPCKINAIRQPVMINNELSQIELLGWWERDASYYPSVEHFSQYLYHRLFKIRNDHRPLSWMLTTERPASRVARWLVTLSRFGYTRRKAGEVNLSAVVESRGQEILINFSMNLFQNLF